MIYISTAKRLSKPVCLMITILLETTNGITTFCLLKIFYPSYNLWLSLCFAKLSYLLHKLSLSLYKARSSQLGTLQLSASSITLGVPQCSRSSRRRRCVLAEQFIIFGHRRLSREYITYIGESSVFRCG